MKQFQKKLPNVKKRKGVCAHYAVVLMILLKRGIQSYIIEGYTKQYGKVSSLAHAWTAAKLITSGMCLILLGALVT
jgi:transglutaminase/protease-like cytokinesis protein 3